MDRLGAMLACALAFPNIACAPTEKNTHADPSASLSASAPEGMGARDASAIPAALDPHGPELAMLGIDVPPDDGPTGRGRLGSDFGKKTEFADLGSPAISGRLSRELALSIAQKKTPELYRCYHERLAKEPTLVGDLSIALTIDAQGRIAESSTSGTLTDAPLIACLKTSVFSELTFPLPGKDPLVVTYPLKFELGTTVSGKSILGITDEDVASALAKAHCTEVANRGPAYPNGPTIFTAKQSGNAVAVALVLVSGKPLTRKTIAKLAEKGALYHQRDPFVVAVAIEGDADKSRATALLGAIVIDPK